MSNIEITYSPSTVHEFACDAETRSIIRRYVDGKSKRPLLLYGDCGSGKSKLAKLLPYSICPDFNACDLIWIDAGLDRGVDRIRGIENEVSLFAMNDMNFRAVVIDEADQLSSDAMLALKNLLPRFMEREGAHVQFVLTTNYIHRIDDAVRDRCEEVHLAPPEIQQLLPLAREILKQHNCSIPTNLVEKVLDVNSNNGRISYRDFYKRMEKLIY